MKKETIELKNKIKFARQEKELSQEELAALSGVTRQTIIALEKGSYNPSVKLSLILSIILEKKVEELFYLE